MTQTFILTETRAYRWTIKIFIKSHVEDKIDQRNVTFTTEHKVSEKERNRNAKLVAAEFTTDDEVLIDAMLRDTGYGITFVAEGDPEGKLKKPGFNVTPLDAKKLALKNLFDAIGLDFDQTKPVEVLTEEYQIFVSAKTGVKPNKGTATEIPATPVDVGQEIENKAAEARKKYEEKYGEPVPTELHDDKGFLSAVLDDPKFDAKAYIEAKGASDDTLPDTAGELQTLYKQVFGKDVANIKKNDVEWMKKKITSAQ